MFSDTIVSKKTKGKYHGKSISLSDDFSIDHWRQDLLRSGDLFRTQYFIEKNQMSWQEHSVDKIDYVQEHFIKHNSLSKKTKG